MEKCFYCQILLLKLTVKYSLIHYLKKHYIILNNDMMNKN